METQGREEGSMARAGCLSLYVFGKWGKIGFKLMHPGNPPASPFLSLMNVQSQGQVKAKRT